MSGKQTLHMETTMIAPGKTAGEIISELVAVGVNQINQTYAAGQLVGIRWVMRADGQDLLFDMPVRVEPAYVIFAKRRGHKTGRNQQGQIVYPQDMEKAERVAWRQLLRWIQAQVAMIQTGMVRAEEALVGGRVSKAYSNVLLTSAAVKSPSCPGSIPWGGNRPAKLARGGALPTMTEEDNITVERHRTAIRRTAISRPIRLAQERGILTPGDTLFDYGCGHGDDIRLLADSGYSASGWDPLNFDTGKKCSASVVNLGYVLNVIEAPAERSAGNAAPGRRSSACTSTASVKMWGRRCLFVVN